MPQLLAENSRLTADRIVLYCDKSASDAGNDDKLEKIILDTTNDQLITTSCGGAQNKYEVVQLLEANNDKKSRFMLVRAADKSSWLYCSGLKSEIFPKLSDITSAQSHTVFLQEGVTTLVARCRGFVEDTSCKGLTGQSDDKVSLLCAVGPTCSLKQMWNVVFPSSPLFSFREVQAADMTYPFNKLMPFNHHMTHTLEAFYKQPTTLQVYKSCATDDVYTRAITLSIGELKVQFAILHVFLQYLPEKPRAEVLAEKQPMGRILKMNKIETRVQLQSVFKIDEDPELSKYLTLPSYGRLAVIFCNDKPAIHVLEVLNKECEGSTPAM